MDYYRRSDGTLEMHERTNDHLVATVNYHERRAEWHLRQVVSAKNEQKARKKRCRCTCTHGK